MRSCKYKYICISGCKITRVYKLLFLIKKKNMSTIFVKFFTCYSFFSLDVNLFINLNLHIKVVRECMEKKKKLN